MSLIKEYFELTNKYIREYGEKTILLMQVGSFFEVYGVKTQNTILNSKISDFSQICELNITEKNVCVSSDKENIMMAGFKDIMIEKYLKKLQIAGFTTIVYTQDQPSKNTTRSCTGIFSPGTYFSNDNSILTNNITCLWFELIDNKVLFKGQHLVMGITNIDILTGKTHMIQFEQPYFNNPTTFDDLERFISIYQPNEAILIYNLEESKMNNIISYINLNSSKIHRISLVSKEPQAIKAKNCENQIYQKEIINRFYEDKFDIFQNDFSSDIIACQGFCFLLDFVERHNPQLVRKISYPELENTSNKLHLANHTLKQLNIINDLNYKGKFSSVSTMLNECSTSMGKRKFQFILTSPTRDIEYLQEEYNITEYLLDKEKDKFDRIKSDLSTMKDLAKFERSIFLKKISPKSFVILLDNLKIIRDIYNKTKNKKKIATFFNKRTNKFNELSHFLNNIEGFIQAYFNLEIAKTCDQISGFESNFINRGINHELDKKSNELKKNELYLEEIRKYLNNLVPEKTKAKTTEFIKIHETEKNSFALICTSRRCKLLETVLPDKEKETILKIEQDGLYHEIPFIVGKKTFEYKTQSSANNFITNTHIKNICSKITSLKTGLKDDITLVYHDLLVQFENYQNDFQELIDFITLIDIIYTKAIIASKYNLTKPVIQKQKKAFFSAKKIRHLLIENIQSDEIYISNDLDLGTTSQNGILLYGTNAVGKTSFIKSIGISIILAQAGMFVPCDEFIYSPYEYIFTRILGNDNIFKGMSTFAVEMSELRTILNHSNENSLILGDELCSGTEISSAIGIFVSGIQTLVKKNSSFMFATHLHEIINYDEIKSLKEVSLKHMEVYYDREKDILVYNRKLMDGPGNNMYGLEVCKSLHLPNDFLENAFNIRLKYTGDTSVLSFKTSHFNSKKLVGLCENCGEKKASETHHLQYQKNADKNGIIKNDNMIFHKNSVANLMALCEDCHRIFHKKKQTKRIKTTKGTKIDTVEEVQNI